MGLAGNSSVISSMWLMNSVAYSWSITMLDNLMTALVSQSYSQEGGDDNEYLKYTYKFCYIISRFKMLCNLNSSIYFTKLIFILNCFYLHDDVYLFRTSSNSDEHLC